MAIDDEPRTPWVKIGIVIGVCGVLALTALVAFGCDNSWAWDGPKGHHDRIIEGGSR